MSQGSLPERQTCDTASRLLTGIALLQTVYSLEAALDRIYTFAEVASWKSRRFSREDTNNALPGICFAARAVHSAQCKGDEVRLCISFRQDGRVITEMAPRDSMDSIAGKGLADCARLLAHCRQPLCHHSPSRTYRYPTELRTIMGTWKYAPGLSDLPPGKSLRLCWIAYATGLGFLYLLFAAYNDSATSSWQDAEVLLQDMPFYSESDLPYAKPKDLTRAVARAEQVWRKSVFKRDRLIAKCGGVENMRMFAKKPFGRSQRTLIFLQCKGEEPVLKISLAYTIWDVYTPSWPCREYIASALWISLKQYRLAFETERIGSGGDVAQDFLSSHVMLTYSAGRQIHLRTAIRF